MGLDGAWVREWPCWHLQHECHRKRGTPWEWKLSLQVLRGGSTPWVLLQDSSHKVCPVSLLQGLWLEAVPRKHLTSGESGFGFRAAKDLTQPWDNSTSQKAKRKIPSNELKPPECALATAGSCLHALECTYTCKCVHTFHLTLNTELLPYIPVYFFLARSGMCAHKHMQGLPSTWGHKGSQVAQTSAVATQY